MHALGNPQNNYKVVHIAGTSGKTSTAYYTADLLRRMGAKVGLTVSPHVTDVNERVQIDGTALPEAMFCDELGEFLEIINKLSVSPSYYELLVAFAFWEFDRQAVDYAVVEVGLGGLLDGTNVISRPDKICVITDIGFDHVRLLGNTLPEIAAQKAGIIYEHNVVFCYAQTNEVDDVIREVCRREHAVLNVSVSSQPDLQSDVPLFQQHNFALALQAARYIQERDQLRVITNQQKVASMCTHIPGRMEVFRWQGRMLVLDGAHNGQKMQALTKSLAKRFPDTQFTVVLSISMATEDKTDQMLDALLPLSSRVIVTPFTVQQDLRKHSTSIHEILKQCEQRGFSSIERADSVADAYAMLLDDTNTHALICGSLYLLNKVRPLVIADHATVDI